MAVCCNMHVPVADEQGDWLLCLPCCKPFVGSKLCRFQVFCDTKAFKDRINALWCVQRPGDVCWAVVLCADVQRLPLLAICETALSCLVLGAYGMTAVSL
jgi:hypothetical protein